MSALLLQELAFEAGLPEDALSVVPVPREVADSLVTDSRIRLLTFTGSPEVGWEMKSRAGKKKVVLELGGNAACIVGPDADLPGVAAKLVSGCFAYSGQVCISAQWIFVFRELFDTLREELLRATEKLVVVGDPADRGVMVGHMIDDASREMEGVAEEAFAPLAVIEPVSGRDEAISRVADTCFGLQVGVFTNDLGAVWRCWEEIEVGGVIHNDTPQFRVDHMPYGGVRDSESGTAGSAVRVHATR